MDDTEAAIPVIEKHTIEIQAYRTPSGEPTCCVDHSAGQTCKFLGLRKFGTVDVCMLGPQVDLERVDGFTKPHTGCLVWRPTGTGPWAAARDVYDSVRDSIWDI